MILFFWVGWTAYLTSFIELCISSCTNWKDQFGESACKGIKNGINCCVGESKTGAILQYFTIHVTVSLRHASISSFEF